MLFVFKIQIDRTINIGHWPWRKRDNRIINSLQVQRACWKSMSSSYFRLMCSISIPCWSSSIPLTISELGTAKLGLKFALGANVLSSSIISTHWEIDEYWRRRVPLKLRLRCLYYWAIKNVNTIIAWRGLAISFPSFVSYEHTQHRTSASTIRRELKLFKQSRYSPG